MIIVINSSYRAGKCDPNCTFIWCIKESVYKFHEIGNIDFIKDISVPEFILKDSGEMDISFKNNTLKSYYFKVRNSYLSYVCK